MGTENSPAPPVGLAFSTVSMQVRRSRKRALEAEDIAEESRSARGRRGPAARQADVGDDEDAMPQEEPQATRSFLPGLPPHLAEAVNQQTRYIADGLVAYIEKYHPRLRSQATANVPTEADAPYRTMYEAFVSSTEYEAATMALRTSAAYDENQSVFGRSSPTYQAPPSGPAAQRKDEINQASTKRGLNKAAKKAGLEQIATTFEGKWKAKLTAAPPVFKWNERVLELLVALSTALFAAISRIFTTQEVEAMFVNGRILVSANEAPAVKTLVGATLNGVFADGAALFAALSGPISRENVAALAGLVSVLGTPAGGGEQLTDEQRRGVQMLGQAQLDNAILDDREEAEDLQGVLTTVRRMLTEDLALLSGGSAETAGKLITHPGYAGRIIVVDAGQRPAASPSAKADACTHAEQNLMLALAYSKYRGGAQVAGKKRPCACCYLTLKLVDDHGYRLKYNQQAGGFWSGTTYLGLLKVARELGSLDAAQLNGWIKSVLTAHEFRQYVTLVKGLAPDGYQVAATDVIGSKAKASGRFTTSEGPASIRLRYPAPTDAAGDEEEDEESDRMKEGYE
ncbi:hypothetical protein [Streptomyces hyaluromycini]|uniref:hypothetical protein n=1 Tax=Streptomyces hyaluromycini TaxID=1377993 RepID=UPI000B5C6D13|nr:hypothetical protein [Streptomyces hyaluromycini]